MFDGPHLSYSPTVIGLYDLLSEYFDVTIIAKSPRNFNNKPILNRNVIYLKEMKSKNHYRINNKFFWLLSLFHKDFSTLRKTKVNIETLYEFFLIKKYIADSKPNIIIAVDFRSLWYAELLNLNVEFLSLEISENDLFYNKCNKLNINSVIIQTVERFQYLFKDKPLKTFLIQNAPVYQRFIDKPVRRGLIYCGTAWNPFGFYHCLEFIKTFSEYSLTVKGAVLEPDLIKIKTKYSEILSNKQLSIDDSYLDDAEVVNYLRQFKIGFCFYNFEIDWVDTFNYHSAPSGKMFKYLAAGVPVVGIDVSGLHPIKEFDCGVLIKDLSPQSIKKAIDKIESNFEYYSNNCLKAAEHYSFDKATKPFIDYLLES